MLLVINAGPKMATIPEGLLQMKEEDALKALADAGLTGRAVAANDEDKDDVKGTVINVTPAEGTSIPATQVVTLTIATGQSRLPSLLGMTREEALQEAADYGFNNLVFEPEDGTTVLRTDPQPQTLIDRDARVTVHLQPAAPSPSPTSARQTPDPTTEPDPSEPTPSPSPTP